MAVFGATVKGTNLEIISHVTSNNPSRFTNYIEFAAMPTPRQPTLNSQRAIVSEDSTSFNIFPASCANFQSLTSSIQCRSAHIINSRSGFSTS
jgi:hypothetical protein